MRVLCDDRRSRRPRSGRPSSRCWTERTSEELGRESRGLFLRHGADDVRPFPSLPLPAFPSPPLPSLFPLTRQPTHRSWLIRDKVRKFGENDEFDRLMLEPEHIKSVNSSSGGKKRQMGPGQREKKLEEVVRFSFFPLPPFPLRSSSTNPLFPAVVSGSPP